MRYRVRYFNTWGGEFIPCVMWGYERASREFIQAKIILINLDKVTLEKFNFLEWKWEEINRHKFDKNFIRG